jgi:hypothetical protein
MIFSDHDLQIAKLSYGNSRSRERHKHALCPLGLQQEPIIFVPNAVTESIDAGARIFIPAMCRLTERQELDIRNARS